MSEEMLDDTHRGGVLELAQRLIRTPSLTGQEGDLARAVTDVMPMLGFHEVHVDDWGNVVGVMRGRHSGSVMLDAHMDTVPWRPEHWQHDPLGAEVADDRLWGRGASDMKGALAAAIHAVGLLSARPDDLGTVYLSCTVCEEPAEGPALVHICRQWQPRHVVIMEATELNLNVGQRGRAELVLETIGRPAHSSSPHLGVNAVRLMARLLQALDRLSLPRDELLGAGQLEATDIVSEPYPGLSVIPSRCRATIDRRVLVSETAERVVAEVADLAQELGIDARVHVAESPIRTYTGAEWTYRAFAPAWKTDPASPLVETALRSLRAIGQNPSLSRYGFCTNGSGSAGILGIPTIGYGPGREAEAHIVDEYLELDHLFKATEGYMALARALSRL